MVGRDSSLRGTSKATFLPLAGAQVTTGRSRRRNAALQRGKDISNKCPAWHYLRTWRRVRSASSQASTGKAVSKTSQRSHAEDAWWLGVIQADIDNLPKKQIAQETSVSTTVTEMQTTLGSDKNLALLPG